MTHFRNAIRFLLRFVLRILSGFLRIAFFLLYYPFASFYDLVAWIVSFGEWADWRRCAIPFLPNGPLLEIAHGTGTLSIDLARKGFSVTAFDLSPAMNRIAYEKIRRWKKNLLARKESPLRVPTIARANVYRLPYRSGYFTSAVSTFPAEFIWDERTLREIRRVLNKDGVWVMIPSAFGKWLPDRFLQWGDVPDWVHSRFSQAGFMIDLHIVRRPKSNVLVMIAKKK